MAIDGSSIPITLRWSQWTAHRSVSPCTASGARLEVRKAWLELSKQMLGYDKSVPTSILLVIGAPPNRLFTFPALIVNIFSQNP